MSGQNHEASSDNHQASHDEHRQGYPSVSPQPKFDDIETRIIDFWKKDDTFQASIDNRDGASEYVFYDGPPFANGLPHYGHLLTSYVKDTVPRYQTMRGHKVERRFGWDCHGLPVEMEAEKQLGFSGKAAISDFGIDKFNDYCHQSVVRYTDEWESVITRAARWVDFENDYKTLDITYMESVMWAFKALFDKGLVYEGRRVLAYCWECETPLSNFETRLDDAYRKRVDPAVTVAFHLHDGRELLVWTTTPWTLPSNQAIAVGADIDYNEYTLGDRRLIIGAATVAKYKAELKDAELVRTFKGSELVGLTYAPLFDFYKDTPNAFQILKTDFVSTEDGTGAVHMSPGFGEDDYYACQAAGIPMAMPVTTQAVFTSEVPPYEGLQVFEANPKIVEDLKAAGRVFKREQYTHSYPHCWRSDTPLIYKAMSSWFVKVTDLRWRMVRTNSEINWIPSHIKEGRFGKWIADARDWSISRNRFWGSPIPVWKSDNPKYPRIDVYGSLDELEADFGVRPTNLHRPEIDNLTRPNPDDPTGESKMVRVDDVMDCWFESGSMPYAQVHYPFENKEWFENNFPADFIVEYQPQTRGWFYTLHVLATALFDRPAFKTCVAHGTVLGDDGRKMSKRLHNYPDVNEVFSTLGSDATRWTLMSSPVLRGGETLAEREYIVQSSRQVLVPIWNAYYFLTLYGNTDGIRGRFRTDQTGSLDRYILAKTAALRDEVTQAMDASDPYGATVVITRFIDSLNNWYIRRSRERFWRAVPTNGSVDQDKIDAYDTLHTVLSTLCRIVAPLLPMLSEEIYKGLTGERSVHLADWPTETELPHDAELVEAMDLARNVCSEVLSVRKEERLRVRLPLAKVSIATNASPSETFRSLIEIIAEETNVKAVEFTSDVDSLAKYKLSVDPRKAGPRIGGSVQQVLGAARKGDYQRNDDGTVTAAGVELQPGEFDLVLEPLDASNSRALSNNVGVVKVDTKVTAELATEGIARDVIRAVQQERRNADLHISDRIDLNVEGTKSSDEITKALELFRDEISAQTLAAAFAVGTAPAGSWHTADVDIEDGQVRISLRKQG